MLKVMKEASVQRSWWRGNLYFEKEIATPDWGLVRNDIPTE